MDKEFITLTELTVKPETLYLYVPPIVWKGDSVGHIGKRDLFFWVIEGECFLRIDNQNYIIRPGQLAYLPKGKVRAYTHASERFTMYEMAFSASSKGKSLMEILGLTEGDYVVDIAQKEEMSALFENAHRKEMFKNPLYDVAWCANILSIINIYASERAKQHTQEKEIFRPVIEYMSENIGKSIKLEELAALAYMQPTYFIKRFSKNFDISPLAYFNRMKIYKAMGLLSGTDMSIDQIAKHLGINDTSYFTRMFKKHCSVTPSVYRAEFKNSSGII